VVAVQSIASKQRAAAIACQRPRQFEIGEEFAGSIRHGGAGGPRASAGGTAAGVCDLGAVEIGDGAAAAVASAADIAP